MSLIEAKGLYLATWKKKYQKLDDWLFAEYGELDLKDILPPDLSDDKDEQT